MAEHGQSKVFTIGPKGIEIKSREPFRERGLHVKKPNTNQFLISEPKQWLGYATKDVSEIVQ